MNTLTHSSDLVKLLIAKYREELTVFDKKQAEEAKSKCVYDSELKIDENCQEIQDYYHARTEWLQELWEIK